MNMLKEYDRRQYLGGADMAAILGLSKWKSPLDVWEAKVKGVETPVTDAMRWGLRMEDDIADEYKRAKGVMVWKCKRTFIHDTLPFAGSLDRLVSPSAKHVAMVGNKVKTDTLLEVKTSRSAEGWGEDGTDEIPLYYVPQVMHYLGLTGCQHGDVAVLIAGSDFRTYRLERDDELVGRMWQEAEKFWRDYVATKTPPPPRTAEEVERLFRDTGTAVVVSADVEAAIRAYARRKDDIKRGEDVLAELKDQICVALGGASGATLPDGTLIATWKAAKTTKTTRWPEVAEIALKSLSDDEKQAILDQCTIEVPGSRRFLVKIKEETTA